MTQTRNAESQETCQVPENKNSKKLKHLISRQKQKNNPK